MEGGWLIHPLPLRERVGRGVAPASSTLRTRRLAVPSPPHPNPLPQGERETEVPSTKGVIANSTVLGLAPPGSDLPPLRGSNQAPRRLVRAGSGDHCGTKQIRNERSRDQRAVKTNLAACQASTAVCETASEAARWASPTEIRGWAVPTPR